MKTLVLASIAAMVNAWAYEAHHVVAGVAQCILTEHAPEVLERCDQILAALNNSQTTHEGIHRFVEAAIFADLIKTQGGQFQQQWHFNDMPINNQYRLHQTRFLAPDAELLHIRRSAGLTVTSALLQVVQGLALYRDSKPCESEVCAKVKSHYKQGEVESVLLRLLIHYVGDISQPLHNMATDRGGNDFKLKLHYGVDNLHALWDTSMYKYHNTTATPFTPESWSAWYAKTCELADAYDFDYIEYKWSQAAPQQWSVESNKQAVDAYNDIQMNQTVPLQYIMKHQVLTRRKIVLAGVRLANILTRLYQDAQQCDM